MVGLPVCIRTKKNEIVILSDFAQACFSYRITLEETDKGTILHCKHNPFTFGALFIQLFMILLTWIFAGRAAILQLLNSGDVVYFLKSFMIVIVWPVIIGIPSALLEYFARRAASRLVKFLVDAEPYRL